MKFVWPWDRKKVERELGSVESLLATAFKPVNARPAFVNSLRQRLVGSRNPFARVSLSTLELILLIGGAIVGALVLVFTLLRRFLGLFGGRRPEKASAPQKKPKPLSADAKKRAA
ncbi:MAG TPA: hypothetical protein VJ182_06520 [Anaerolineales bacterium]|nr:hypothetical protein [Anaerolineales bacterium]